MSELAPRCWLYVPAHSERKVQKALGAGAEALLLDLEDAVPHEDKGAARASVASMLEGWSSHGVPLWVRVSPRSLAEDLDAAVRPGLQGVCLAKAESSQQVGRLAGQLEELEVSRGLELGSVSVMPLVETARGVLAAAELAASERVRVLQLGEQDLRADLGLPPTEGADVLPHPLVAARAAVVLASAAAKLWRPVGPVSIDVLDQGIGADTEALRRSGFGSRAVIHPNHVAPVLAAFRPSEQELAFAREVLDAVEGSADGSGAVRDVAGRMVDDPVLRQARAVLLAADRAEHSS